MQTRWNSLHSVRKYLSHCDGYSCRATRRAGNERRFYNSGRRACDDAIGRHIVRDHAIGPHDTARANRDSFENMRSAADPRTLAYPDRSNVFRIGSALGDPLLQRRRVAIVIGDSTVGRDEYVVFDHNLLVAGNCHIAADKDPVPDPQSRTIAESARIDGETTTESDIVANMQYGVSTDHRQSLQLQMLAHGLTPAAK